MQKELRPLPFVMVTGGCRSGKSVYAERVAGHFSKACLYVATAEAYDEEMRSRIRAHQKRRGDGWRLHEMRREEAPHLWQQLPSLVRPGESLLFDCLSLWAAACMQGDKPAEAFPDLCRKLLRALWELRCPVVLVNSEVGMGVVPASPAGRAFRDMAGLAGQTAAAFATNVVLMVSGLPVAVKGELPLFDESGIFGE